MGAALRPIREADAPAILALNNAHAVELSWLTPDSLRALLGLAWHARMDEAGHAFLIALRQDAAYDGVNFGWFRARYPRFVYVDRIAVAAEARGRGLAAALYADLFARAAAAGETLVGCEVNLDPPNPASDAFHAARGFIEAGRARLSNGKTVRYLTRTLSVAFRHQNETTP